MDRKCEVRNCVTRTPDPTLVINLDISEYMEVGITRYNSSQGYVTLPVLREPFKEDTAVPAKGN